MLVRIFYLFASLMWCFIVHLYNSSFFYVINKRRRNTNKRNEGEKLSYLRIKIIHFLLTIYFMMIIFNLNKGLSYVCFLSGKYAPCFKLSIFLLVFVFFKCKFKLCSRYYSQFLLSIGMLFYNSSRA